MISCPSTVCASYANLEEEVRALGEAGTGIFHCDIADGSFVSNISMGLMDVKAVRTSTKKTVDVHSMADHPAGKTGWFLDVGADLIYIHPESEPQAMKILIYICSRGKPSGLAANPDTNLSTVKESLPHCDYPLIMSMFPGFVGQTSTDSMDTKIRELVACKKMYGYRIILDGACPPAAIQKYHVLSVDGFVPGTSTLFHGEDGYMENMNLLRSLWHKEYHNGTYASGIQSYKYTVYLLVWTRKKIDRRMHSLVTRMLEAI